MSNIQFTTNWRLGTAESDDSKILTRQNAMPCEITFQVAQAVDTINLFCTARKAEVCSIAPPLNIPSYICTLKGLETSATTPDGAIVYQITWKPEGGIQPGSVLLLRTLSLQNPDALVLSRLFGSTSSNTIPMHVEQRTTTSAVPNNTSNPTTKTPLSQMDEIKRMVESMAAESAGIDSAANPKQALMAAIARSALKAPSGMNGTAAVVQSNAVLGQQMPFPTSTAAIHQQPQQRVSSPSPTTNNKVESLIELMLGKLTLQQASIDSLSTEIQAVRQECSELKEVVQQLVALNAAVLQQQQRCSE